MWLEEVDAVLSRVEADLSSLTLEEVRARRAECLKVEGKVSYLRRLVQGRLDIVQADLGRRQRHEPPADLPTLVEQLPGILSDRAHAPGPGRLPASPTPTDDAELTSELDALAGAERLASLAHLPDEDVEGLARQLSELERRVSERRRALFAAIDDLQDELVRRYRSGEATIGSVLGGS
jgi:hypothetical protein